MTIFEADTTWHSAVERFYLQQGYGGGWSASERAFIGLNTRKEIIGAVKIDSCDNVTVLRGMYIAAECQRKGLGSEFIHYIEPMLSQSVTFCLPYAHLKDFYRLIGFEVIEGAQCPPLLSARLARYLADGNLAIAMRREAGMRSSQ